MNRPRSTFFILIASLAVATACVSVKLKSDVPKSQNVDVSEPRGSFRALALPPADQAWKSNRTGNTISYFSECTNNFVSLERMRDDVLLALPQSKLVNSTPATFDGREALDSQIEGRLEGIPLRVSLLVYQKNGCRYSLSYSGRADQFNDELPEFERFKRGFRAP